MLVIFTAVLLITNARDAAESVKNSIKLCAGTLAPSMLPFLTLTAYIGRSGMLAESGRPFDKLSGRIFRLPGESFCIFLMSMTGGFPVGEKMIACAFERGTLSSSQAKRMALFCIGGGPAFVINTVGVFMVGSMKAGVIFLVSLVTSSLITAIASRFFAKDDFSFGASFKSDTAGNALISSVEDSIRSIINICGWIIIFNAFISLIASHLPQNAKLIFTMITEVTGGCAAAAGSFPLPVTASVLGFGGLCVHCQVLPYIKSVGLPYKQFLCARVLNAASAAVISFLLFKLFPCDAPAFAPNTQIVPVAWSVSFPAAAAFLLTVSLMILDLATKEKV